MNSYILSIRSKKAINRFLVLAFSIFTFSFSWGQNVPSNAQSNGVLNNESEAAEKIVLESTAVKEKARTLKSKKESKLNTNSFEYNYQNYLAASSKNKKSFEFLQKAYEIYPDNVALYDDFMAYYEMNENATGRRQFSSKLAKSNTISSYLMEYNFNVLASLPLNSVLFTNGFDDTYPIWISQDVDNVRKDITIINISLLGDKTYLKRIFEKENIRYNHTLSGADLIADVMKSNAQKNIFIGLTVDKKIIEKLHKNLYLTGLAFKYSEKAFPNVKQTTEVWENSFKKSSLNSLPSTFKEKQVLANYLIPMIYIHNRYVDLGEVKKAEELKKIALKIAAYNGKSKIVTSKLK